MNEFGVQASAFTDEIHVGQLNPERTAFLDKQAMTGGVLRAVA